MCAGDFDGNWCCGLAVGVPGKDVHAKIYGKNYELFLDAGTVDVIYGSETGLCTVNGETWHQNMAGIQGTCDSGDSFGSSLPGSQWFSRDWP